MSKRKGEKICKIKLKDLKYKEGGLGVNTQKEGLPACRSWLASKLQYDLPSPRSPAASHRATTQEHQWMLCEEPCSHVQLSQHRSRE